MKISYVFLSFSVSYLGLLLVPNLDYIISWSLTLEHSVDDKESCDRYLVCAQPNVSFLQRGCFKVICW